jgi:potassium efflux system protein
MRLCFCFVLSCHALIALAEPAADDATLPPSHAAAIASAKQALSHRHDLDAADRQQAEQLLDQAEDDEKRADELAEQWRRLRQTSEGAAAAAEKLEQALARDNSPSLLAWRKSLPENATAEQLEALLDKERAALAAARDAVADLHAQIERESTRPAELRDELAAAYAALDRARTATTPLARSTPLAQAQVLRAQAAERLATTQVALLELENRSLEPRQRLLAAQLHDRQRAVAELEQHVALLEARVLERTAADAAQFCARVALPKDPSEPLPALREAAARNAALCDRLVQIIARMGELRRTRQAIDAARQDTELALANTEERIRIGGISEAVGLILLAEQRKLKPLPQLRRELAALQAELTKARMDSIDLREQQNAIAELQANELAAGGSAPPELRAEWFRLYALRGEILARLATQQARLTTLLSSAEEELRELVEATTRLGAMLDTHLLWMPSHLPVDPAWLARLPHDVAAWSTAQEARAVASGLVQAVAARPLASVAGVLLLIALGLFAQRAPARLRMIAGPLRRIRTDRYRLTFAALGWTLLRAAPLPVALWLLGKLTQAASSLDHAANEDAAAAWFALVVPSAALAFLRALTAEYGLAQYHFRWPRAQRESLRAAVVPFAALTLPCLFLLRALGTSPAVDTVGRLSLAIAFLGAGALGAWLLAPGRLWTTRHGAVTEPARMRQAARITIVGVCALLALLDLRGYFVTAQTLGAHFLQALGLLLVIATLHGLAVRWLMLGERRLAFARLAENRVAAEGAERTDGAPTVERIEAEAMSLASIGAQTRRLLRALTAIAVGAALLWVFADITPALAMLTNITVWDATELQDGKELVLHVSLRDLLEAVLLFLLTWVATRNLPGLLEVGVLRRFDIDPPTRYAITSVTRYVIVFAGSLFGLALLGLRWSNLQWLAAGFSVGLGFGMQEIFANFISGLMVLFERPFRIGDVITIGNVEGTVARIRTRATTIVDWDNREIVVPNKSFITDRLVNWTLSDSTTRIVIKVGVAYRNDPAEVRDLLLELARAHPLVLREPAPSCWMTGFGESTQDFELRVYVAEIDQRNPVRTELQFRIAAAFREHDIEIAFPQRDVWIRNAAALQPAPSAAATSASNRR